MGFIKNAFASSTGPSQVNNGLNQSFVPFSGGGAKAGLPSGPPPGVHPTPAPQQYPNTGPRWTDTPPAYGKPLGMPSSYDKTLNGYYAPRANDNTSAQSMQRPPFRPIALPQITSGKGQPFLPAYSNELGYYGISPRQFVEVVDSINKAIIPNKANKVFQSAATVGGLFLPELDAVALMVGQIGVGVGFAVGHASMIARGLSKANLNVFIPARLEIGIGTSANIDQDLGIPEQSVSPYSSDPQSRVAAYGNLLAPLSMVYSPLNGAGRNNVATDDGNNQNGRGRARRERRQGRRGSDNDKTDAKEDNKLQWLIVRPANPESVAKWQKTLQQSEAALGKEPE